MIDIRINKSIEDLLGKNKTIYKNNTYYISQLNFDTFASIIRNENIELFNDIMINKDARFAINFIIKQNIEKKPIEIFNYINSLNIDQIIYLGKKQRQIFDNILKEQEFYKKKFKGFIYLSENKNINIDFIFNEIPDMLVLFIYNKQTSELIIYNKEGKILRKEKIKETKIEKEFESYTITKLKKDYKKTINNEIITLLDTFLNLNDFFNDFTDEIINRLLSMLNIVDLEEETIKKLEKLKEEKNISEKLAKGITDRLKQKKLKRKAKELEKVLVK